MLNFHVRLRTTMLTSLTLLGSLVCVVCESSTALAQSEAIKVASKQYLNDVELAKKNFLKDLDTVETKIRNARIAPDLKVQQLKIVTSAQEAFRNSGELPHSDLLVSLSFEYLSTVYKRRLPVYKLYQIALDRAVKAEDTEAYQGLIKWRDELDTSIIKDLKPLGSKKWGGTLYKAKRGIQVNYWFREAKDGGITSTMVLNPGVTNAVIVDFLVHRDGFHIMLSSTKVVRGAKRKIIAEGFIIGKRIIMKTNDTHTKGPTANGWVIIGR